MARYSIQKGIISNKLLIEENNKATREKLFHLLLVVIGLILGWLLCYFFPLIEQQSLLTGNL